MQLLNLDTESLSSYIWRLSQSLDEVSLGLGVLELHGLDSAEVVQVSWVLVVRWALRECRLDDELSGLLVQVLGQVWSQNNICYCCLTYQVFSEACGFVWIKHQWSNCSKEAHLFVGQGNEVHGFGTKMIQSPEVDILQSGVHKVTELLGILVVSIVNELHQEEVVQEQLDLRWPSQLLLSLSGTVQESLELSSIWNISSLLGQVKTHEEIWQIVWKDKNNVCQFKKLSELL